MTIQIGEKNIKVTQAIKDTFNYLRMDLKVYLKHGY